MGGLDRGHLEWVDRTTIRELRANLIWVVLPYFAHRTGAARNELRGEAARRAGAADRKFCGPCPFRQAECPFRQKRLVGGAAFRQGVEFNRNFGFAAGQEM